MGADPGCVDQHRGHSPVLPTGAPLEAFDVPAARTYLSLDSDTFLCDAGGQEVPHMDQDARDFGGSSPTYGQVKVIDEADNLRQVYDGTTWIDLPSHVGQKDAIAFLEGKLSTTGQATA